MVTEAQFDSTNEKINKIVIEEIGDEHVHWRDDDERGDGRLEMIAPYIESAYGVTGMQPNIFHRRTGKPILTNPRATRAYKGRIRRHLHDPHSVRLAPLYFATDTLDSELLTAGWNSVDRYGSRDCYGVKVYFPGVTSTDGQGVHDIKNTWPYLKIMSDRDRLGGRAMVYMIHVARTHLHGKKVTILEHERRGIDFDLEPTIRQFPEACYVVAHVSDKYTLDFIRYWWSEGVEIYGEICPQYLYREFDDLFAGGVFHGHELCWPLYQIDSRTALIEAAFSGEPCFTWSTDMAWHVHNPNRLKGVKTNSENRTCGGLGLTPETAISLMIERAEEMDGLHTLNQLMSRSVLNRFGLAPRYRNIYRREPWKIPEWIERTSKDGRNLRVAPFMRQETRQWRLTKRVPI